MSSNPLVKAEEEARKIKDIELMIEL